MIEQKAINVIRKLALDEIAEANSGHPGIALGIAPIMFAVYKNAKICPQKPNWFNRDRIVLSAGHGSSVLYSTLHLFGYGITIDDLKNFRKLGSITPGHPEVDVTPGVDASTGALGQGFAMSVGIALAEAHLAAKYNKKDAKVCDHFTFCICGDGDLMEGISYEAASLAGKFGLNKLICLYDSNGVTMTDNLNITQTEDTKMRFTACGWSVLEVKDGEDFLQVEEAIKQAKKSKDKPTMIICNTKIGYGSKLEGKSKCHGSPFTKDEVKEICQNFGVSSVPFEVEKDVQKFFTKFKDKNLKEFEAYEQMLKSFKALNKKEYDQIFKDDTNELLKVLEKQKFVEPIAIRNAVGQILNALAKKSQNFFGGGADVAKSTMAYLDFDQNFAKNNKTAQNIPFGVREHAMGALANGIALHGGLRPFASTFLIFSDYMKYSIRQSALMDKNVLYLFSHDSIFVGEDGPSHQPIEQVSSLELVPNLTVFRPADGVETVAAFKTYLTNTNPTVVIASRQKLPVLKGSNVEKACFGAYVISKEKQKLDAILLANGSEVELALKAQKSLLDLGIDVRVVSMPSPMIFEKQTKQYQNSVLPNSCQKRVAISVARPEMWWRFVGLNGAVLGVTNFGESGKGIEIASLFGIDEKAVIKAVKKIIK